ncbi:putative thioredoxin [Gammaproteobacteria bacterium]
MADNSFVFNVTLNTFPALVLDQSQKVPVVVDFWAAWCNPCQVLMPMLAKLAKEYQGKFLLAKVNTDQERELAQQYGVRSLPTVKIFRHGKAVEEFMGAQPESTVRGYLDRHIERKSEQLRQQAVAMQQQGDLDTALLYLRQALELEPTNNAIQLDLARLFMARGELEEARGILRALPDTQPELRSLIGFLDLAEVAQSADRLALETVLTDDPINHEARYRLATLQTLEKDYLNAMENLLEIVRRDRKFRDDGARKALLTIFDLLGADSDLAIRYRKRLLNLLH